MKTQWVENFSMLTRIVAVSHTVRMLQNHGGHLVTEPLIVIDKC